METVELRTNGALSRASLRARGAALAPANATWRDPLIIQQTSARPGMSLSGRWQIIIDPCDAGRYGDFREHGANASSADPARAQPSEPIEHGFTGGPTLRVPGDWSSQRKELLFYEGTVWYQRTFAAHTRADQRSFVAFEAVSQRAVVYLNGARVGEHEGGFTPFAFEVSDLLRDGDNVLVVKVDNRRQLEAIPSSATDWWNYGGIIREVRLLTLPTTFVRDYFFHLGERGDMIEGWMQLDGPGRDPVRVELPELGLAALALPDAQGKARVHFAAQLTLWSPSRPKRYALEIQSGTERIKDLLGFRRIEVRGHELWLNGERIFLRGISMHDEAFGFEPHRVRSEKEAHELLSHAKKLGANFVRLAHYPHPELTVREAERMGLLVMEELPVYGAVAWQNRATLQSARAQLAELIARDKNRACTILWSVANEPPQTEAQLAFMRTLIDDVRRLDPTRLVTAALELRRAADTRGLDDALGDALDVLGLNEGVGWGQASPELAELPGGGSRHKPVIASALGADACAGLHGPKDQHFTEEFQAAVYDAQLARVRGIEALCGVTPWVLKDYRSPRRVLPRLHELWNRKGLVSERGEVKQAFEVLRAFYRELAATR